DLEARKIAADAGYKEAAAEAQRATASVARQPKELTIMDDLVRRGVARDQREAWEMVQTGKGRSPDVIAASLLASQNPPLHGRERPRAGHEGRHGDCWLHARHHAYSARHPPAEQRRQLQLRSGAVNG